MFLSMGCFASSLTRSQVVAAVISLVPGVSLFILAYLARAVPATAQWQTQVLSYFGLFDQMDDFTRAWWTRAWWFFTRASPCFSCS